MQGTKRPADSDQPLPSPKKPATDADPLLPDVRKPAPDDGGSEEACAARLRQFEEEVAVAKRKLDEARRMSVEGCRQLRETRAAATLEAVLNNRFVGPLQLPHKFVVTHVKLDWACILGSGSSDMDEWFATELIRCGIAYGEQRLLCSLSMTGGSLHQLCMTLTQLDDASTICRSVSPLSSYVVCGDTQWRPRVVIADASAAQGTLGALLYGVPAIHSYIARLMLLLPTLAHLVPGQDEVCTAMEHFPEAHKDHVSTVHILARCGPARALDRGAPDRDASDRDALKRHTSTCTKCVVYSLPVLGHVYTYLTYRCGTDRSKEEANIYEGKLSKSDYALNKNALPCGDSVFETGWYSWDDNDLRKFPTLERLACTDRVWAPFAEFMYGVVRHSGAEYYESLPANERWC